MYTVGLWKSDWISVGSLQCHKLHDYLHMNALFIISAVWFCCAAYTCSHSDSVYYLCLRLKNPKFRNIHTTHRPIIHYYYWGWIVKQIVDRLVRLLSPTTITHISLSSSSTSVPYISSADRVARSTYKHPGLSSKANNIPLKRRRKADRPSECELQHELPQKSGLLEHAYNMKKSS